MPVNRLTDQRLLRESQYANTNQLHARMRLHELYTVAAKPWFPWLIEKINLKTGDRVLELGCGSGDLWLETQNQRPEDIEYFLSDFSSGMLQTAKSRIQESTFSFAVMDAQQIGMPTHTFDVVIADHMLYHVPDIPKAVKEIRRVLKPGGRFIAATNGEKHLRGMYDLLQQFDSTMPSQRHPVSFTLENGPKWLEQEFEQISCLRHDSALHIRDIQPLLAYYRSLQTMTIDVEEINQPAFVEFLEEYLKAQGMIIIEKDAGVLIAS